jgi:cell wall-associated protease
MKNKQILFIVYLFLMINNCWSQQKLTPIKAPAVTYRNRLPVPIRECWQHLDIEKDTLSGTSLNRAYQEIIKNKKGKSVIVAVIDTDIDIHHEDLKQAIWVNKKEIPNNKIDDDHNGYIDDINGWNFMGNSNGGDDIIYANTESTRVLRSLKKKYPNYSNFKKNTADSLLYIKAIERYEKEIAEIDDLKIYVSENIVQYKKAILLLEKNFHKTQFNYREYDSLYFKNKKGDSTLVETIIFMRNMARLNKTELVLKNDSIRIVDQYKTSLNQAYYDRSLTGDNESDIKDNRYGNNNVYKNAEFTYHGTMVSGLIAANRANKIGVEGFGDQIMIMPIHAVPVAGSECSKDVALAIRYAVDNGAKIINMSFGNTSLFASAPMVDDALLYAQRHDVLLVAGAGNDMKDNDITPFYPLDYDIASGKEFCNNFIKVGAITLDGDKNFLATFTNYGKQTVDLFASGQSVKTTYAGSKYGYRDGTSMASPIVSGVAALVRSYYPKLTASQVKQIILDSGVAYDNLQVQVPGEAAGVLKPFSEMSKSGKVVNAYNALLMAGEVSKKAIGNRQNKK